MIESLYVFYNRTRAILYEIDICEIHCVKQQFTATFIGIDCIFFFANQTCISRSKLIDLFIYALCNCIASVSIVIWLIDEDANKRFVAQECITIADYYSRRALPITKHHKRL